MRSGLTLAAPVFGFQDRVAFADVSAWISGFSFAAGLGLAGSARIDEAIAAGLPVFPILAVAFAGFLACVLMIQRHMRLSLVANTFGSPQRLVTSGIFRYSRNPIYVAFFLPLASLAVISLAAAIAACAIYVLTMDLTVIRKEERELLEAFGSEFADYLTEVPRWVI